MDTDQSVGDKVSKANPFFLHLSLLKCWYSQTELITECKPLAFNFVKKVQLIKANKKQTKDQNKAVGLTFYYSLLPHTHTQNLKIITHTRTKIISLLQNYYFLFNLETTRAIH